MFLPRQPLKGAMSAEALQRAKELKAKFSKIDNEANDEEKGDGNSGMMVHA